MKLKRLVAVTLACTMVFGTVVADAAVLSDSSISGTGEVEYLMDLDVMSYEVSTSAATDKIFSFILDPQEVIKDTKAQEDSPYNGKITTDGTLYFPNIQEGSEATEASVTKTGEGMAAIALKEGYAGGKAGTYTYKTTDANDGWGEESTVLEADGWFDADTISDWASLDTAPTPIDVSEFVTITGAPASGDTITVTDATEAVDASYKYSPTSDEITAVNKGFVAGNISITATLSNMGSTVKTNSASAFTGSTKPEIYLAVVANTKDKTGAAGDTPVTTAFASDSTTAFVFGTLAANAKSDFSTKYYPEVAATGDTPKRDAYYGKEANEGIKNTEYFFKITGAANPNGVWPTTLQDFAPKLDVVWNITKQGSAAVAVTDAGLISIGSDDNPLTTEANYASMKIAYIDGVMYEVTNNRGTWSLDDYDAVTGGKCAFQLDSAWMGALVREGETTPVTVIVTLTDGSTVIASHTFPAAS